MNTYEKNLDYIKKYQPFINLEKIEKIEKNNNLEIIVSKDNNKIFRLSNGEQKIFFHSSYYPKKGGENFIKQIEDTKPEKAIIFGFGFGYNINAFLNRFKNSDFELIVYEPNYKIFNECIRNVDISHLLAEEKLIIIIDDLKQLETSFDKIKDSYREKDIEYYIFPPYLQFFKKEALDFYNLINRLIAKKNISDNTAVFFSKLWTTTVIKNMDYILNSYNSNYLKKFLKDIPVVIVAAGPSLNKNIHLLKNFKNKGIIVCLYTAYKPLREAGIDPDFIVSIDTKQISLESEEELKKTFSVPLIFNSQTSNDLLKKHTGKKILIVSYADVFLKETLKRHNINMIETLSGGSVSNDTLHLFYQIGSNPIIFIGQDFAFDGDKTHAGGTYYDKENLTENNIFFDKDYIEVDGVNQKQVKTNISYNEFRLWTEHFIKANEENVYINATEGGAKINGTIEMSFKDAIDKYCNFDYSNYFKENFEMFYKEGKTFSSKSKKDFSLEFKNLEKDLNLLLIIIKENVILSNKLVKVYNESNPSIKSKFINKTLTLLNNNDKKMKNFNTALELATYIFQSTARRVAGVTDTSKSISKELLIAKQSYYTYKGLENNVTELISFLKESFERNG